MSGLKKAVFRTGLEALYFSGAHVLLRPLLGGVGAILTLHHVRPPRADAFQPNRLLEVTPQFLEDVLKGLRRARLDLVTPDEMHRRLSQRDFSRRFVCVTFDDGYRDNLLHALPLLQKYDVPFALYIPTSFPDRAGDLWWLTLEAVVASQNRISLPMHGEDQHFHCDTPEAKYQVYEHIYWWLRGLESEDVLRAELRELARRYGVDTEAFCRDLCMTWREIGEIAADPLATIGAHTVNHVMLRKASDEAARHEMRQSRSVIEAALGRKVEHFCYPVGDRTSAGPREFRIAADLGFKTAVTTRPGVVFPEHAGHLTALPRISLNGEYQRRRYAKVLMSGAATAMWNGFRRVDAA